jgi:hypothetical protein
MTRREERMLLTEAHENNIMLREICQVINMYLSRHHQENEEDFGRNVLANLVSEMVNSRRFNSKK